MAALEKHQASDNGLIGILETIQGTHGYLPESVLRTVAAETGRSLVDIYGVATFYRSFSLRPRGKHVVCVCLGTTCHVRGAPMVVEEFERQLGIKAGETTPDNQFTLETANCLGACAIGPVVSVDGHCFAKVSAAKVRQILEETRAGLASATASVVSDHCQRESEELAEKLGSLEDLKALQRRLIERRNVRLPVIVIPAGTCGQASGAAALLRAAQETIAAEGLSHRLLLRSTGCHGFCEMEPSLLVEPDRTFYPKVQIKDVARIIRAAARREVVEDLLWSDPVAGKPIARQDELPFYRKQVRNILAWNEKVDPTRIETYLGSGGYAALVQVLERNDPAEVVKEVKASGLRGRGGAGFPTGLKWELLARQPDARGKFLVCNADEGDPGAYMDRSVLEGNPQAIIEGLLIGAYATGATQGVVYVRNEYPLAIGHLAVALEQARGLGLLGKNILGTGFSFDIKMARGAGAFVCGEETALVRSIEGRMGEPRQRPPFPVHRGIQGRPTAINNVETWANIPLLIAKGGRSFAKIGAPGNSGTKIFSLVGKIRNTGLVEVPMGISIREIIYDIGGGPADPGQTKIKAVQTGGPSGGCIPEDKFDLPIDYDSLVHAGSIMGSGGMIVMDDTTCMVDLAKYFTHFLKDESCGKCLSCRKGTQRMYEILDDVSRGQGAPEQLELLEELAQVVKDTAMCGLGQTAPNPVLSTLRYFRDEYLEHITNKRCPAGVCKSLINYAVTQGCTGCQACVSVCPTKAISGARKKRQIIDATKCIRCGACRSVCKSGAVRVT